MIHLWIIVNKYMKTSECEIVSIKPFWHTTIYVLNITIYLLLNYSYFILIIQLPMYHPIYLVTIYILSKYLSSINLPIYDLSISIQHLINNNQNLWLLHNTIVVCCCELLKITVLLLRNKKGQYKPTRKTKRSVKKRIKLNYFIVKASEEILWV